MTTPSRDRRGLAAGRSSGRFLGRFRRGRGSVTSMALAWALVLAPRPSLAGAAATAPPAEGTPTEEAGPDEQVERAMAAYQRGTQNYNLAQYEAALADFTEAASLYASPDFQYNIGLCYEKLDKYEDAIRAFAAYLRAKPDAEDRPNVENRIHALEQELERRKREAEEDEAAARRAQQERSAVPPPAAPVTSDERPPTAGRPLIIAGAALVGVGAAVALGGGIALGVVAGKRSQAVDDVQTGGNPEGLTFAETQQLEHEGKRFEGIEVGLVAGGAAVAVTGAVLLALGLRKRQQATGAQAWLRPLYGGATGPAGLVITGRF